MINYDIDKQWMYQRTLSYNIAPWHLENVLKYCVFFNGEHF